VATFSGDEHGVAATKNTGDVCGEGERLPPRPP